MTLRRVVVVEEGVALVPHAVRSRGGTPPGRPERQAHKREGHILESSGRSVFGPLYVCAVCGEIFVDVPP